MGQRAVIRAECLTPGVSHPWERTHGPIRVLLDGYGLRSAVNGDTFISGPFLSCYRWNGTANIYRRLHLFFSVEQYPALALDLVLTSHTIAPSNSPPHPHLHFRGHRYGWFSRCLHHRGVYSPRTFHMHHLLANLRAVEASRLPRLLPRRLFNDLLRSSRPSPSPAIS